MQSFRKENGRTSSRVHRKLGRLDDLLEKYDGNQEKLMAWAKSEAAKDTRLYNEQSGEISISLSQSAYIPKDEERSFNVGYLFLQHLCTELRFDAICRKIKRRHQYSYDLSAILTDLIFARILSPASKLSSYTFCQTLLEPPRYTLQNLYRALSVIAAESDFIQEELYRNSNSVQPRNRTVLYYDCTNYYFEIEEPEGNRQYGKSKEHRPNPIITMGLFMDADGTAFCSDQPSCLTGSTGKFFRQHFCCLSFCSACDQVHEQGFFHFLGNCPGISPDSLGVIHARPLTFQYLVNLLLVDMGK